MTTQISGKNGGNAYFQMDSSKKNAGTWKVISVKSVKLSKTKTKWVPGKWLGGQWIEGYQGYKYSAKTLSTAKLTKAQKKAALKVIRGKGTKLALTAASSNYASKGTLDVKATLKDENGKPVKGAKVKFLARPGLKGKEAAYGVLTTTITTDSKGIAQGSIKVPRESSGEKSYRGFGVTATYGGAAKKYVASFSATKYITQPKEPAQLESNIEWDGHTGNKDFTMKVVSTDTKKPVEGVPVKWEFTESGKTAVAFTVSADTNKDGVATAKVLLEPTEWNDWSITVTAGEIHSPYIVAKSKTATVKKKQRTVKYTFNKNKVSLLNHAGKDWLKLDTAASRSTVYLYGSPDVITVGSSSAPTLPTSFSSDPFTYKITSASGKSNGQVISPEGEVFAQHGEKDKVVLAPAKNGMHLELGNPNPPLTDVTKVTVKIKLGDFQDKSFPETLYVPSGPREISIELAAK